MINQWTAYPEIERYAQFDFDMACDEADKKWALDPQLIDMDIKLMSLPEDEIQTYNITGTFLVEGLEFKVTYSCIDDPNKDELEFQEFTGMTLHDAFRKRYYESMNQPEDAKYFADRLAKSGIQAATAIMAADDDDPFADMGFDEPTDDGPEGGPEGGDLAPQGDTDDVNDTLDDMADTLDDLNDALEDVEEDDVDIDIDNNISDHFIAECEKCKGVFITAIEETDQEIEKITGTCPLCDEECDQYIKWVIKEL